MTWLPRYSVFLRDGTVCIVSFGSFSSSSSFGNASPRSFSKMNADFATFKTAMLDGTVPLRQTHAQIKSQECTAFSGTTCCLHGFMLLLVGLTQDCSSTATFKGVCACISRSKPHAFILENVDTIDTATGEEDEKEYHGWRWRNALNRILILLCHCR